jgi:N-acetylneuraminate synthase/N,N'-diacetyllegionaminate synthase
LAATGRPVILSTGMASWNEIDEAVAAIRATGNEKLVLLQCTTNYPSTLEEANLRVMPAMAKRYNCFFGYSDHTQEHTACLAAVALGARAVERHFTLDRSLPGPDHQASDEPSAFTELVAQIRNVELTRGSDEKQPTASELLNSEGMRRSLVARRAIPTGTRLTDEDLICQRPATGLEPRYWSDLVGLIAKRDIAAGTQISFEDFHG